MRKNGTKPRDKNTMKEKKNEKKMEVATPGFEPALLLPPAQNVKPQTTGPCDQCAKYRKMPKITPSKYKPPKPVTQKIIHLIAPPNISSRGLVLGKLPSNTK